MIVQKYFVPIRNWNPDALVLAALCTHAATLSDWPLSELQNWGCRMACCRTHRRRGSRRRGSAGRCKAQPTAPPLEPRSTAPRGSRGLRTTVPRVQVGFMFYFLFFYTLDSQKAQVFWDREYQLRQGSSVGLARIMIHHSRIGRHSAS